MRPRHNAAWVRQRFPGAVCKVEHSPMWGMTCVVRTAEGELLSRSSTRADMPADCGTIKRAWARARLVIEALHTPKEEPAPITHCPHCGKALDPLTR